MEDDLIFKRFPADKQDQVRGLVEYATLMGLSGKDLISIGGKLDRLKAAAERNRNMDLIKSLTIYPIGIDSKQTGVRLQQALNDRFKIKTANGDYNFVYDYNSWHITSLKTRQIARYSPASYYELGNIGWAWRARYTMMLELAHGKIALNF